MQFYLALDPADSGDVRINRFHAIQQLSFFQLRIDALRGVQVSHLDFAGPSAMKSLRFLGLPPHMGRSGVRRFARFGSANACRDIVLLMVIERKNSSCHSAQDLPVPKPMCDRSLEHVLYRFKRHTLLLAYKSALARKLVSRR